MTSTQSLRVRYIALTASVLLLALLGCNGSLVVPPATTGGDTTTAPAQTGSEAPAPAEGVFHFDVRREAPAVRAGAGDPLPVLSDGAFHTLSVGDRLTTDITGEALLQSRSGGSVCKVYVFRSTELVKRACPKSANEAGNTICHAQGSAIYKDCGNHLKAIETPSAEFRVLGSWVEVIYLPAAQRSLVLVFEGEVVARPVLDMEARTLAAPDTVPAGYFWFTDPGVAADAVAGLAGREPHPMEELAPLIDALRLDPWMERTRDHAEEDTTFFPDWLTCAEGVLYCEDFDDSLAAWWDLDDAWSIERQGSGYALNGNAYGWAWLTDHAWDNYRLRFRVKSPGGTLHINYRATPVPGGIRRYWVGFSGEGLYLHKSPGQGVLELAGVEATHQLNRWHEVELAAQGGRLQVYVDDKLELDYTDREPLTEGGVAFEMLSGQATIDDIEILPGKLLPPTERPPTRRPPTEAPPSEPECEVASVRLNLRGGPGTNYPILGAVTQGARLTPLGRNPEATWLLVRVSATGQQGWVSGGSQYVRCNFPLVELPEVEIPAPPRPPPPTMPPPTSPPPTAPPPPPYVSCWVEPEVITQGGCATLGWDVRNVNQIYLDGNGVTGREDRQVCPYESRTYTLQVISNAGVQYCSMQVQVVQVALAAPQQISPPDGAVFYHVPRTTYLEWTAVPGAASYTVEIDCLLCCDPDQWCTDVGVTWGVFPGITATNYRHDFVGAQPGRWRVWAVDAYGNAGPKSGWRGFEYLQ